MKMVGLSAAAACALLTAVAALGQGDEPDKRVNIVWIVAEDMSPISRAARHGVPRP